MRAGCGGQDAAGGVAGRVLRCGCARCGGSSSRGPARLAHPDPSQSSRGGPEAPHHPSRHLARAGPTRAASLGGRIGPARPGPALVRLTTACVADMPAHASRLRGPSRKRVRAGVGAAAPRGGRQSAAGLDRLRDVARARGPSSRLLASRGPPPRCATKGLAAGLWAGSARPARPSAAAARARLRGVAKRQEARADALAQADSDAPAEAQRARAIVLRQAWTRDWAMRGSAGWGWPRAGGCGTPAARARVRRRAAQARPRPSARAHSDSLRPGAAPPPAPGARARPRRPLGRCLCWPVARAWLQLGSGSGPGSGPDPRPVPAPTWRRRRSTARPGPPASLCRLPGRARGSAAERARPEVGRGQVMTPVRRVTAPWSRRVSTLRVGPRRSLGPDPTRRAARRRAERLTRKAPKPRGMEATGPRQPAGGARDAGARGARPG